MYEIKWIQNNCRNSYYTTASLIVSKIISKKLIRLKLLYLNKVFLP